MKPGKISLLSAQIMADAYNEQGAYLGGRFDRLDAEATNVLALALEDMRARVYEDEYPTLKARQFFPVSTDVDAGAEFYGITRSDFGGEAEIISADGHADDLPSVEVSQSKEVRPVIDLGDSYRWSRKEIMNAAYMNMPLSSRKAIAARRVYERKFDEIAAVGAPAFGIPSGLLNDSNVDVKALASAGTWATKIATNPSLVLNDLNKLVRAVSVDSKELYDVARVLVPTDQFYLLAQTKLTAESDRTILEAFRMANPKIQMVDSWNLLDGAGAGGLDRIMAYAPRAEAIEIVEPMGFTVLPPESRNLAFVVNCWGRTAGGVIEQPLAAAYMDGV